MKKLISFVTFLTLSMSIFSQSVVSVDWGPYRDMPDETSYQQAVGFDSDAYYYVRSDHKVGLNRLHVWLESVSSLTNSFEQSNEIMLPSVGGVQTEYEALFYRQKKFVLFTSASDKNRNQLVLYVSYIKPDGSISNKPKEIASVPLSNIPEDGFNIFLSTDEKQIVIESHKTFSKYNSDPINTVVLDFNLSEIFKGKIELPESYNNKEFIFVQNAYDNGKYIFLAKSEIINTRRSSTNTSYNFVVFVYNIAKKSLFDFTVEMPKYKVSDARFTINKEGNVVVGGYITGRSVKFVNEKIGMFFKQYNPNTLKPIDDVSIKSFFYKFPREFITEIQNPNYGENKEIMYAYSVNSVEELANGGYIILAEQKWEDGRTVTKARNKEETGIKYFHYNNIMAGGVGKTGNFEWTKIYPKVQNTTNDYGYYSSYKVVKIMNKVKLFYNDDKANLHTGELKKVKEFNNNPRTKVRGTAGVYTIYMDGSYERDPMFTGKDNDVVIIPQTFAPNSIERSVGVMSGNKVKFGSFILE